MKNVRNLVPWSNLERIFRTDIGVVKQTFSTIDKQLVEPPLGREFPISDIPINGILEDWKKSVSKCLQRDSKLWLHQHIAELETKREFSAREGWQDHVFDESLSYLLRQVRKHSLQWISMIVHYLMSVYGKRNSHEGTPSSIEIFFEICAQTDQVEPIRECKLFYQECPLLISMTMMMIMDQLIWIYPMILGSMRGSME